MTEKINVSVQFVAYINFTIARHHSLKLLNKIIVSTYTIH